MPQKPFNESESASSETFKFIKFLFASNYFVFVILGA